MKLYDELNAFGSRTRRPDGGWDAQPPYAPPASGAPTVVDVSNIAAYFAQSEKDSWALDEFPNVAPPWPITFFEYTVPAEYTFNRKTVINPSRGDRVGCLQMAAKLDLGGWSVNNHIFWSPRDALPGALPIRLGRVGYLLGPKGEFLTEDGPFPASTRLTQEDLAFLSEAALPKRGDLSMHFAGSSGGDGLIAEEIQYRMMDALTIVLLSTSFTHCKNVLTVENSTPPKVARKRVASGKPPGVTYKTLVIDGMKETLRTEGGIAQNGLKKALHICRGHFATYTADAPLFGKFVGTVWKSPHVRGSKERGQVVKDYKVVANER